MTNSTGDKAASGERPRVALFVTCLADLLRPSVARASLRLLEAAGCEVVVPPSQTCCGQPGYNNGDYRNARLIAQQVIDTFDAYDYIVAPSGSCAGMLREHYPRLLKGEWQQRAERFGTRVYELTQFLHDVCGFQPTAQEQRTVAYHDSCAGLRELAIRQQPRALLDQAHITVQELESRDVCCGFGGTFCAKMPELSAHMADEKLTDIEQSGAALLTGGDLGCLLALAGRAKREGLTMEFRHVAELLSPEPNTPPIGEPQRS